MSDAEPEPEGDIEWFTSPITGMTFAVTSASYVAFAAPRGRFLIGRSGDVRGGHPGLNIIGLDKAC